MRIKLLRGYQTQLVLKAKTNDNLTWRELAKKLGLNENYLKNDIRKEIRTISKENYTHLCNISKKNFDNFIENELDDKWGQKKGGTNVKPPKLLIEKESEELAELIGVILGDGNIYAGKKGYYYLTIAGDKNKDKEYLLGYVSSLIEKLFGKEMRVRYSKKTNGMWIVTGSRDIVYTLKKYGLNDGDKINNNQGVPEWIFSSKDYIKACLRGLLDTDGCVSPITGRNYNFVWFTSKIPQLRNDFYRAMKILGIKTSKWSEKKSQVFIGSKEMIKKYIQTVGFKNQRHLCKLKPL